MSIMLKATPRNNPMEFHGNMNGVKIMGYKDLTPYYLNDDFRGYTDKVSREEYNNLQSNIAQNGLNKAIEGWILKDTGQIVIAGGHTRRKILETLGITDFPVVISGESDHMLCEKLNNYWSSDNVRCNPSPIAKFNTIERQVEKTEKALNRPLTKEEKNTICYKKNLNPSSSGLYTKIHHLKYGYHSNGNWVEPRPDLIKDLEEGNKDASVGSLHKVQLKHHKSHYNDEKRLYNQDPDLEKVMQKIRSGDKNSLDIDSDIAKGLKEFILKLDKLDVKGFRGIYLRDNSDPSCISNILSQLAACYFAECFNKIDSEFTAVSSKNSEHYDIYIKNRKGNEKVNSIEVKCTNNPASPKWVSGKPKNGYHLLINYSKELNFYVSLMYIDIGIWNEYSGNWTLTLNDARTESQNTFIHEIAGRTILDDGKYIVQRDVIDI